MEVTGGIYRWKLRARFAGGVAFFTSLSNLIKNGPKLANLALKLLQVGWLGGLVVSKTIPTPSRSLVELSF